MRRLGLVLGTCAFLWGLLLAWPSSSGGPRAGLWAQESSAPAPASSAATASSSSASSFPSAASQPAATTAPTPGSLWSSCLERVQKGRFAEALADVRQAAVLTPQDARFIAATGLLENFVAAHKKWDQERQREFERAGDRVKRSLLAQSYMTKVLTDANAQKRLRDRAFEMGTQMARVAASDWVEQATPEKIREMQARAAEAAAKMSASLDEAVKALHDDSSEFGKTFGELAGRLRQRIAAYGKAWESVRPDANGGERRAASRDIAVVEEELSDAMADIESMVSDQPWRVGLAHARLARTVSPAHDGMHEFVWYRELVQTVTARGEEAMKAGKWYDALGVYSGLADLEPDNETFRTRAKEARRHARVLSLYGRKADANAAPEEEPRWQELTQGVDADIVRNVIEQLDEQYVSAVDYRKLTRGALAAIQVLAETPEAAHSFEGLADPAKKKQFLADIARELDNVQKTDRVDFVYLTDTLHTVLRASERSVNIPLGVLAMEFTDGFLEELDRFSSMVWPSEVDDFNKQTMGQFYGVGIQISKEPNEPLKVVSPLANSPAFREGVKSGDLILKVDANWTEPMTVDKLVRMIQGPKGTKVVLLVRSRGQTDAREVTLVRDEIRVHTVKGWRLLPGGEGDDWQYYVDPNEKIAYLRITQFTGETPAALDRALVQLERDGCRSLVLDLRMNPGGLLEASKQVVDEFLDGVRRIVVTRGRQKAQREYLSTHGGAFTKGDVVVLVNDMSASASEIVSGALQDCHRAIILGQRSYGKGSVQNVLQIPKHSAYLKLTTAYYYLPSGRLLHRKDGEKDWGVDPQVEIRMTPRQARKWLTLQRKTELVQDTEPAELSADLAEEYQADLPLDTATLILKLLKLQEATTVAGA